MIKKLDNLLTLRNVCIFLVAEFAGFFRIEEVLHIKYGDITFHDTYIAIKVDRSKIDQLRKGNEVLLSRSSSTMLAQSRFSSVMFQSLSVFQWNLVIMFLRWLKTVSSTFQNLDFDVSL